jgi:hypothetical protein
MGDLAPENAQKVNMYMNINGAPPFINDGPSFLLGDDGSFYGAFNKKLIGIPLQHNGQEEEEQENLTFNLNFENTDVNKFCFDFIFQLNPDLRHLVSTLQTVEPKQIEFFYVPYIWQNGNNFQLGVFTGREGNILFTGMVCSVLSIAIECIGPEFNVNNNQIHLNQEPFDQVNIYKAPANFANAYLKMLDLDIEQTSSTAKVLYALDAAGLPPNSIDVDWSKLEDFLPKEGGKRRRNRRTIKRKRRFSRRRRYSRKRRY